MLINNQLWEGRSISAPSVRIQSLLRECVESKWLAAEAERVWLLAHMEAHDEMEMERVGFDTSRLILQGASSLARPTPKVYTTS